MELRLASDSSRVAVVTATGLYRRGQATRRYSIFAGRRRAVSAAEHPPRAAHVHAQLPLHQAVPVGYARGFPFIKPSLSAMLVPVGKVPLDPPHSSELQSRGPGTVQVHAAIRVSAGLSICWICATPPVSPPAPLAAAEPQRQCRVSRRQRHIPATTPYSAKSKRRHPRHTQQYQPNRVDPV
jgi:hypothetical protein